MCHTSNPDEEEDQKSIQSEGLICNTFVSTITPCFWFVELLCCVVCVCM